jgi:DNA-binding MarR family transcriptional regulator
MTTNAIIDLPADYALVLQKIQEDNGEDFVVLSETLNIRYARLNHIIRSLKQKGLVRITHADFGDMWIRLSSRGGKLARAIWPDKNQLAIG